MNILIFNDIGSLFLVFCILVNVYCSDCSTDHQKLNVVQKWAFYFLMTWGSFFLFILHFGRCLPLRLLSRSSEVEHNLKPSISFFDDLGGLFLHFSWFLLLGSLGWSSEVECNPKPSISFFDDLGGLFLHFSWFLLLGSLGRSSEVECNIKMSFSFFDDLGWLFHILIDFHHSDDSANHHCPSQINCTDRRWRR